MFDPRVVDELGDGGRAGDVPKPCGDGPRAVFGDPNDRARVDVRRAKQPITVLAWLGERPLVRPDPAPRPEGFEADAREDAAPSRLAVRPGDDVPLLVRVERRSGITPQDPFRPPRRERPTGPPIPLVLAIAGLVMGQVQPNDVPRVPRQQA